MIPTDAPELVRVRGQVQGVGFRPAVARLAAQLGLPGWVKNDADGVCIALGGSTAQRTRFLDALLGQLPPLARVDDVTRTPLEETASASLPIASFQIVASELAQDRSAAALAVPDTSVCQQCAQEVLDPQARRYRYPFTHCTHCGPRYSIMLALPWDRARTTMRSFEMCAECRAEYDDPHARRYHAEPIACPRCGPSLRLTRSDQRGFELQALSQIDAADAVTTLLRKGAIVALKGLGGYHLLADATQESVVARLRSRKQRPHKPFALMASELTQIERYCLVTPAERESLQSAAAPIVLLRARTPPVPGLAPSLHPLPPSAAATYGFMLPMTPLHALALQRMQRPVVCTSGNRSSEPQVIDEAEACERLADIADWILSHDRPIHNRVDDSVVRVVGEQRRVLRRARGLAPAPLPLPPGFELVAGRQAVWAAGADLKAAVCMSRQRDLLLSQHLGDLDDARTTQQYVRQSARLRALFQHRPSIIAMDNHPDSRAAQHAQALAEELGVPCHSVAHHHAHFAACLGERGVPLDGRTRLGLVLDGIGMGETPDALWGCELLVGDYARVERFGSLRPAALLGGDRAAREPWRCLYAQLRAAFDWQHLEASYGGLPCVARLRQRPLGVLEQLLERGIAVPEASSCGRLFDAVAAGLDVCFAQQTFEAQAAQTLEALIDPASLAQAVAEHAAGEGYRLPTTTDADSALLWLDPRPLWPALLADLAREEPVALLAARFHVALAAGLAQMCGRVAADMARRERPPERVVALSGGCLQNAVLHERLTAELEALDFAVLAHRDVPSNDGGIALGQTLVTLARCAQSASES